MYRYAGPAAALPCPAPYRAYRARGMGETLQQASPQTAAIAATAASAASSVVGTLVALGKITGPVGAAIAGLVAAGYAIANLFGGCGNTCVEASNLANQASSIIDQAYNQYMSAPVHYASMQKAYLQLFDGTWAALVKACSDPALGSAGQRCISDRQAGSCHYQTSPGGWEQSGASWTYTEPGEVGSGSTCWNWFLGRRDPVANDPTVVPDPGSVSNLFSSVAGGGSVLGVPVPVAIGALALLGLAWWAAD